MDSTSLGTKIRVGKLNLEVWAKHHIKGEYHPSIKVDMEVTDPLEELPLISNQGRITNPRDSEKKLLAKNMKMNKNKNLANLEN